MPQPLPADADMLNLGCWKWKSRGLVRMPTVAGRGDKDAWALADKLAGRLLPQQIWRGSQGKRAQARAGGR